MAWGLGQFPAARPHQAPTPAAAPDTRPSSPPPAPPLTEEHHTMGVRSTTPNSLTFTVDVQLSTRKRLRVPITLDLQERYLSLSASIVYEVLPEVDNFLDQLGDIAANQLAFLKWDGNEFTTEFQEVRILAAVQVQRATARFNVVLEPPQPLHVQELSTNQLIWLFNEDSD